MRKGIDIIKQLKEKLGKSADAGDYIDDFKKSDAPQFKGKSDKKKEKMAVAAYLDSKEEVDLEEKRYEYDGKNPIKMSKKEFSKVKNDDKLYSNGKPSIAAFNKKSKVDVFAPVVFEEIEIQESGHTDVASMKTQVQIATDALQKMNTELGKLSDEEDLPTWWTNKVSTAVSKLDGMSDYIGAKQNMGKTMNEKNIQEVSSLELQVYMLADTLAKHPKFTDDMYSDFIDYAMDRDDFGRALRDSVPKQLYNVFKSHLDKQVKVSKLLNMSTDIQGKEEYKSLNESAMGCLQAAMIDNNKSLKKESPIIALGRAAAAAAGTAVGNKIGDKITSSKKMKNKKESKMGELFLDMQMDAQEMDEREFIKVYTKKGFQAAELKSLYKEFSEEVEIGEGKPIKPRKKMSVKDVSKDIDGIKRGKELRIDGVLNPSELVKQLKDKYGSKIKAQYGPSNITVTKEELEEDEKDSSKTATGKKATKVEVEPEIK